ncbi:hypothetical protein [Amnibacterium soli]|uniref:hypothetical protein n=1 Tax=Amnibacterium soli TaxID=1282736 RepID=UPI0031E71A8C
MIFETESAAESERAEQPELETKSVAERAERALETVADLALAQEPDRDGDADAPEQRPVAAAEAPAAAAPRPPRATPSASGTPSGPHPPVRARLGREATGIVVLVVLALVCAGLITAVVVKTRNDAAIAAREAADYTPPPLATPEPVATGPVVAVIGDGSTSSAGSGVTATQRWTALLESSLGGTVDADAAGGMGYAAKSRSGGTFVQAAGDVPSNAKVVVFFGGAADSNIAPLSLAKAATNAYAAAMQQAPDAKILVVGPAISSGVDTTDLATIRDTLRGAAALVQATWIDPVDKDWLPASKRSASPGDLSASDEKAIASKMRDAVEKALR